MKSWLVFLFLLPLPASAQTVPVPSKEDPRVQTVRFVPGEPVRLQTTPGNDLTVMLAPGERVTKVDVSNNAVYQVAVSDARDSFILHTSMVLFQGAPSGDAIISLGTDQRNYNFQLSSQAGVQSPYVLRFTYGGSQRVRSRSIAARTSTYKLTGNRELRPSSIRDDGSKTYIQWNKDQPIPGIFALDRLGREEMVDGYMRDGTFVIDRVHDRLVFRIDDIKAEAVRPGEKSRK